MKKGALLLAVFAIIAIASLAISNSAQARVDGLCCNNIDDTCIFHDDDGSIIYACEGDWV